MKNGFVVYSPGTYVTYKKHKFHGKKSILFTDGSRILSFRFHHYRYGQYVDVRKNTYTCNSEINYNQTKN